MSKVLAVFGATGHQGGSVIKTILNDPELSEKYKVRAITRNPQNEALNKAYGDKIDVVAGDMSDSKSLVTVMTGADIVFYVSQTYFDVSDKYRESLEIRMAADAAEEAKVDYFIFSTLADVTKISGGKYTKANHSTSKGSNDDYIRNKPYKSTFINAGGYFQNINVVPFWVPRKINDDTWALIWPVGPHDAIPYLDVDKDFGKFFAVILDDPKSWEGKIVLAAQAEYTMPQIAEEVSKNTGKKVIFKEVSREEYDGMYGEFLAGDFSETYLSGAEFGYYGTDHKRFLSQAPPGRGSLTTLSEFLIEHPIMLDG